MSFAKIVEVARTSDEIKGIRDSLLNSSVQLQSNPNELAVFGIVSGEPLSIGLTRKEAQPLVASLLHLVDNVGHGTVNRQTPKTLYQSGDDFCAETIRQFGENFSVTELDVFLLLARQKLKSRDPQIRLGIMFDSDQNFGRVFLSHPIILGLSPWYWEFYEGKEKRLALYEAGERGFQGGLYSIEHGPQHQDMQNAGLEHTEVKAIERQLNGIKGTFWRRHTWFNFRRTGIPSGFKLNDRRVNF